MNLLPHLPLQRHSTTFTPAEARCSSWRLQWDSTSAPGQGRKAETLECADMSALSRDLADLSSISSLFVRHVARMQSVVMPTHSKVSIFPSRNILYSLQ